MAYRSESSTHLMVQTCAQPNARMSILFKLLSKTGISTHVWVFSNRKCR
jgi:hypothetical protein